MGTHMGTFSLIWALFPLMFLLVFGLILYQIFRGIRQDRRNDHAPRLTVPATVVAKRQQYHHPMHENSANGIHHHTGSASYYATFQFESGDRLELVIPSGEYGYLVQGDQGLLTFQGSRFLHFSRQ